MARGQGQVQGQKNPRPRLRTFPLEASSRVDRASATEAVDPGSISGRVKSKTMKIGIHSFPA